MNSTEQSKQFMVLTTGQQSFVQEYGPVGSDGKTMRKLAGMALKNGGFIQVGYSAEQFHQMLDEFVVDVTKNRHVGTNGFVAVCDENLNLVTQTKRDGAHISTIGIQPNEEMNNRSSSKELCTATIVKVYFVKDALPDIQKERENARRAFVLGVNTAIPYDVVRVGDGYGLVTELLTAMSITKMIRQSPNDLEEAANHYVNMLRTIHQTKDDSGVLSDMKQTGVEWAAFVAPYLPKEKAQKLQDLFEAIPKS